MARKGAMTKEPVLRGEARKAAKVARRAAEEGQPETSPPVRARPRETRGERLSPGVYRGSEGGLVGRGGRQIARQPQPTANPWDVAGGADGSLYEYLERQAQQQPPQQGNYMLTPEIMARTGFNFGSPNTNAPRFGPDGQQMPQDKMFRYDPSLNQGPQQDLVMRNMMPQMPQASANMGGQYRLSPGVYGTQQQAMNQYNQQLQQMGFQNAMPQVRKG